MLNAHSKRGRIARIAANLPLIFVACAWVAGAFSQETNVPPASAPAAEAAAGGPEAARAALEATAAKYRSLKTYRDEFHFTASIQTKDDEKPEIGELNGTLVFAAPNRFVSKSDAMECYYDGSRRTMRSPMLRQYVVSEGADALRAVRLDGRLDLGPMGYTIHPLAVLLTDRTLKPEEALAIDSLVGVEPETRDGRPGKRLRGVVRLPLGAVDGRIAFSAFISDETRLFEEIRADLTDMAREFAKLQGDALDADAIKQAEIVLTFTNVVLDGDVTDEELAFEPAGERKVETFAQRMEQTISALSLLGLPAPSLSGPTLEGTEFDLADQRDKTTIVAFWGTWAPNAAQLLKALQTIATDNADKPVRVIGVNRNAAAAEKAVRDLLARNGASFPQILDSDGTIAERWQIAALPAVCLIDAKGEVADVFPTWTDASRDVLADRLAKLLKSEPLYTADELSARRGQAGDDDQTDGRRLAIPVEDKGTMTLQSQDVQTVQGSRWNMSQQDVDGDGEIELIFPEWSGGISIVKPSSGHVQRVQLRNCQSVSMQTVQGVSIAGQLCWLCAGTKYNAVADGADRETALVRLYAPGGEILWTFRPETPEGCVTQCCAAAGDLDGDGQMEYAIGLSSYRRRAMGENSWTREDVQGRLIILDHQGRVIAQREPSSQIELLYIPPAAPGKHAPLLCCSMGQLERYTLSPDDKTIQSSDSAGADRQP